MFGFILDIILTLKRASCFGMGNHTAVNGCIKPLKVDNTSVAVHRGFRLTSSQIDVQGRHLPQQRRGEINAC